MAVTPQSINEFLDLLRRSNLHPEQVIAAHLKQVGPMPPSPDKLAASLVRTGLLTPFHAQYLMQGKWRGFFISRYKVLDRVGSGGMGTVYLCEQVHMKRLVALKVLPVAMAKDPSALGRFHREARAAASLDHVNIVRGYDVGQDNNLHFIVMEYVDGVSMHELVKKHGVLSGLRACHYIRQAALGLQHALERGLIHRDIKPANLVVDRQGVVKVLDMGLARFFNDETDDLTRKFDEQMLGTADYLAPEQALDSHTVDTRADIYSLGATLYFMLTSHHPFEGGTVAQKILCHQMKQPKPVAEFRNDVPKEVLQLLDKMMAKKPADRFQTPAELAQALIPLVKTPIPPPDEKELPRLSPLVRARQPGSASSSSVTLPAIDLSAPTPPLRPVIPKTQMPKQQPDAPAGPSLLSRLRQRWKLIAVSAGVLVGLLMVVLMIRWIASFFGGGSLIGGGGLIEVMAATPAASTDLSDEGKIDWVHWGADPKVINRKLGALVISDATEIGKGPFKTFSKSAYRFRWNDGTPKLSVDTDTGRSADSVGSGFQFHALADKTPKTLRVYLGCFKAGGTFEAALSDNSATFRPKNYPVDRSGSTSVVYTVRYQSASDGQRLTIRWIMAEGDGNVTLQAATLAP